MAFKVTVRIGGLAGSTVWDATDQVATFDDGRPLLVAGHMFGGDGNACQYQFVVDDDLGEIPRADLTKNLASHNVVTITEDASGTEYWTARGRIADKTWGRVADAYGDRRGASVTVDDGNIDFRDLALTAHWDRPEETGRARVLAALAAFCNGSPRLTTVIGTHLVAAGGEVTMPAKRYTAGTLLPEIFRDCAEVEGKLWGAVIHHLGGSHLCFEYIDEEDHTTYASTLSITDDGADGITSFAPRWEQGGASIEQGGDRPASHLVSRYGSGDDSFVVVQNSARVTQYDYSAVTFNDDKSETAAQALIRAQAILNSEWAREHVTHQPTIRVPADKVHLIEAGMSIPIKSAASMGGLYLGTTQTRRIAQAKKELVAPAAGGQPALYDVHLQLDRPERVLPRRRGPVGPKPPSGPSVASCVLDPSLMTAVSTPNGDAENPSGGGWSGGGYITGDAHSGTYWYGTNPWPSNNFAYTWGGTFQAGTTYVAHLWVAGQPGVLTVTLGNGSDTGDPFVQDYGGTLLGWTRVCVEWTPASTVSGATLTIQTGSNGMKKFDDVQLYTGAPVDTTQPIGGSGDGSIGSDTNTYSPIGHIHEHGDLSAKTSETHHHASSVKFTPTGTVAATAVQAAIAEVASDAAAALTAHTGDTADAHDASAISFDATGLTNTDADDVQEAIADLDAAIAGGGGPTSLNDLSDVMITSPAAADRIRYDGSGWVNSALIWRPVMTQDPVTSEWRVAVSGEGEAVMTEG